MAPGQTGRTLTALRPAGVVEVAGERVDAVSEGSWIPAGVAVRVIRVEGRKVVVRPLE